MRPLSYTRHACVYTTAPFKEHNTKHEHGILQCGASDSTPAAARTAEATAVAV